MVDALSSLLCSEIPFNIDMGRKSRHKSASRRNALDEAKHLIGLPPTLASVHKLQRCAGQQDSPTDDVLTLHPDFADAEASQMTFDRAVFEKVPGITLIRHPYPSETDLKATYEEEHGIGSSIGLLLMLNVSCPAPSQFGVRTKIPSALSSRDPLYKQLSQGYCALVGEHSASHMFYGVLHQRLPVEIVETGVIPFPANG